MAETMYLSYQSTKRLVYPKRIWKTTAAAKPSEPSGSSRGNGCGGMAGAVARFFLAKDPKRCSHGPLPPSFTEKQIGRSCGRSQALGLREGGPGLEEVLARCPADGAAPSHDEAREGSPARQPSAGIGHVSTPAGLSALLDDLRSAWCWGRGGHVSSPFLMTRKKSW